MENKPLRNFKEVDVGTFVRQTSVARFQVGPGLEDHPELGKWRMGLTALSQKYNLYFAGYGETIHVTVPRNVLQTMPGIADLKIALPKSVASRGVPAHITSIGEIPKPHYMNNLIVANLGNLEIILVCCDDGDVLAYYTHLIDQEIAKLQPTVLRRAFDSLTKPMFHENVGISAWGLAVHEKSRLIAVSSNAVEVTLFSFARNFHGYPVEIPADELFSNSEWFASPRMQLFTRIDQPPASVYHRREGGYKVTFSLLGRSSNMPAISFASDPYGEAEMILAVDIIGKLWQLNLWGRKSRTPLLKRVYGMQTAEGARMQAFKLEAEPADALGMPKCRHIINHYKSSGKDTLCLDITPSKHAVRDPTLDKSSVSLVLESDDPPERPDGPTFYRFAHPSLSSGPIPDSATTPLVSSPGIVVSSRTASTISPQTDIEINSRRQIADFKIMLNGFASLPGRIFDDWRELGALLFPHHTAQPAPYILPDGSAILRTYQFDIELLPPTKATPPTICTDVFGMPARELTNDQQGINRLNMVTCIPELSLVVVASQAGVVALITLTKLEDGFSTRGPVVMFRLDYILPFKNHRTHSGTGLLGIAVSPVWTGQPGGSKSCAGPQRWRLILHYRNFHLLSYELYRDGNNDLFVT
ncbi:uncharacterized protein BP5553_06114 [Venustampulla echinocandica]|uniref:Uncharacterized protein n=1 Tax=Venustampulla echinocandica TaxID=2656787 RepID=A0A370TML2_9HELO|nr:uncharacterized protein BP5553_06114 [Venustampulla echinocandica]RDL36762.1 hypothetical protein BP5553_06114 [Venustampulla echinocandica]